MLTDAERERFIADLDERTLQAEAAKHAAKMTDPLAAVRHEIRSLRYRSLALEYLSELSAENRMRLEKMVNNPSLERSPHTGAPANE